MEEERSEVAPLCLARSGEENTTMSVDHLWNYIKEKKGSRTEGFKQEYDVRAATAAMIFNYHIFPL